MKGKNEDIGNKIAMHIAASNPLAIEKDGIKKEIVNKELEIIKAEITNSGKPPDMAEKISKGNKCVSKFLKISTGLSVNVRNCLIGCEKRKILYNCFHKIQKSFRSTLIVCFFPC